MGFFANAVGAFRKAAKAGSDFNPVLEEVLSGLEQLHRDGKLEDTVYKAEQAYTTEHTTYLSKGIHTDAADSQRDVQALRHLMTALRQDKEMLEPAVREQAEKLLELYDDMNHILGNILKA